MSSIPNWVKQVFILLTLFISIHPASASSIQIEPIASYDYDQRSNPSPHLVGRLTVGGRILIGEPTFTFEAEYTRGEDREEFANRSVENTVDKLKLGLRSGTYLTKTLRLDIRSGAQLRKHRYVETSGGQTTSTVSQPLSTAPYLGVLWVLDLGTQLKADLGVTAVVNDIQDLRQNEYQTQFGISYQLYEL